MTAYAAYGEKERENLTKLFQNLGITEYRFTSSTGMDKVDGAYKWNGAMYVVEAKVRACNRATYPSHLIEQPKYQELVAWQAKGFKPVYINFFWDGAIIYDLSQRIQNNTLTFHATTMPKASAEDKGTKTKYCAFLEVDKALGDLTLTSRPRPAA